LPVGIDFAADWLAASFLGVPAILNGPTLGAYHPLNGLMCD
jgi:hypothetical protein